MPLQAQQAKPDLTLTGTVTRTDFTTYRELPFTVPPGVTRISVDLSYTEHEKHTNIDLGIFDGERFRGWSGGNKSYFTISEIEPRDAALYERYRALAPASSARTPANRV